MKLKKITVVGIAAAVVLVVGVAVVFATIHPDKRESESQLNAAPQVQDRSIDLSTLNNGVVFMNAEIPVQSITEGEIASGSHVSRSPSNQSQGYYRSFVIKFRQDMDANTLNPQNVLAYIDGNATEANCNYSAKSQELQVDVKVDAGQSGVVDNTATIRVLLSKDIKTADGTPIDEDYDYTVAGNE